MANPVWPGTLPESPLLDGFTEEYEDFNATFEPDAGLPSSWPRSSAAKLTTPWRLLLTTAQKNALFTFWKTTCAMGSLPFDMTDPVSETTVTVKFVGGVRFEAGAGPRPWFAQFQLTRLA